MNKAWGEVHSDLMNLEAQTLPPTATPQKRDNASRKADDK